MTNMQEPVAVVRVYPLRGDESTPKIIIDWRDGRPVYGPLYARPTYRKPLTDEEADELVRRFARYELIRATEAKHGIVA